MFQLALIKAAYAPLALFCTVAVSFHILNQPKYIKFRQLREQPEIAMFSVFAVADILREAQQCATMRYLNLVKHN